MEIGTSRDSRHLDAVTIADYGVSQAVLMENAALAAREVVQRRWGISGKAILLVCGSGSNGGDGFALARQLHARGAAVTVVLVGSPAKMTGAAAENYAAVRQLPLIFRQLDSSPQPTLLDSLDFNHYDLIVDALFGTGLSRNLDGAVAALVACINAAATPVLSLDLPSGVSADTGEVLLHAIRADATVTFGIPKRGNLLYPGFALGGDLYYSEISFPPEAIQDASINLKVNIPPFPPARNPAGHKGSFGKILVVGGSSQYMGAPALTAKAALKSGAGYSWLALPADLAPRILPLLPEALFLPQECDGTMGPEHLSDLVEKSAEMDAVIIGPGLSSHSEAIKLVREFVPLVKGPLLIDADGLTAVAGREELCRYRPDPVVLTPHPGEMARLLGTSIREVEARRVDIALEAAERYGAIVVLKGAHSIIADSQGRAWMNLTGNSGMATAGSGDVLSGLIGTLIAQDDAATDAVRLGVHIHGLAGDLLAEKQGPAGITAGSLIDSIPGALACFRSRLDDDPFSGKIIPL